MSSLDSARQTIAIFDRQIAEAENETRQRVERLVAAGLSYESAEVKKAWDDCGASLRLIREARENLVKAIAIVVGMTAPTIVHETP